MARRLGVLDKKFRSYYYHPLDITDEECEGTLANEQRNLDDNYKVIDGANMHIKQETNFNLFFCQLILAQTVSLQLS